MNWLAPAPAAPRAVTVKLRSASPPAAARVMATPDGAAEVVLEQPQAGVAPGQACVIYDGDRVLGGGWIARAGAGEREERGRAA